MYKSAGRKLVFITALIFVSMYAVAQGDARVNARMDARQIVIGDQARLFLEATHNPAAGRLEWPAIPDTINQLEIVEKGKIDTVKNGGTVTYRQRLLVTGFDSGVFHIPPFQFAIIPGGGQPALLLSDSFDLLVQGIAVDTTKAFKPIKNIIYVKSTWLDYIWYIVGALLFIGLGIFVAAYFLKNKKNVVPAPRKPAIPIQDQMLARLAELDARQLWQKNQVKEYYVELTDIVRGYIELRFSTPALELTTDELLYKAKMHRDLQPYISLLTVILQTADLAKFAKWQPLPQEHFDAMENAKKFIDSSRPAPVTTVNQPEKKI